MSRKSKSKYAVVFTDPAVQEIHDKCFDAKFKLTAVPIFDLPVDKIIKRTQPLIRNLEALSNEYVRMFDRIPESELKGAYFDVDSFYREIAEIYGIIGDDTLERSWLEKSLELLNSAPSTVDLTEEKLEVSVSILRDSVRLRQGDQAKKYIKLCNELYSRSRAIEASKEKDQERKPPAYRQRENSKMLECSPLDITHLSLIEGYHEYYTNVEKNTDKRVHYGILSKKYEVKYRQCDSAAPWISDLVGFAIECRKLGAGKQCHHLLKAAKSMFNKRKHNLKGDEENPLHFDPDFLESFIDVELANYFLWILECPTSERAKLGGKLVNSGSFIEFEGLGISNVQDELDLQREKMSAVEIKELVEKVKKLIGNIEERELQWDMLNFLDFKDTSRKLMQVAMTVTLHTNKRK